MPSVHEEPAQQQPVLSTLNQDGSRRWIKPRLSHGRLLNRRRALAYFLILLFTTIPYISLNGKPLVLLDLTTRHFTIFGKTFLPTDTLLLALLLVGIFVLIFLLSALFGRVWCGWACPQTVYMEFVFRPIERLFEGAPGRSKKGPLAGKPFSKPAKIILYLLISMYLAHTFLAYFVGVENLRHWITSSPLNHPAPFLVVLVVTGLMLFNFGFFREQLCIIACPYGRFQSAMLDRNSLIVTYDPRRGEPRGKATRPQADVSLKVVGEPSPPVGDCVDCGLCVATCPTGIDIRNGLQMECVNCTQCIDACNAVMTKLNRPRGLIRYSSQALIAGEKPSLLRPRVVIYPAIFLAVAAAFVITLSNQGPAEITILRGIGRPFVDLPGGEIGNPIKIKITNRTDTPAKYFIELADTKAMHLTIQENPIHLGPGESKTITGMIAAQPSALAGDHPAAKLTVTQANAPAGAEPFVQHLNFTVIGKGQHRAHTAEKHDEKQDGHK